MSCVNRRKSLGEEIEVPFNHNEVKHDLKGKTVAIIGGVAGGASCAARLRRNDEDVVINIYERGSYVSFANCGLPYYVGGIIKEKGDLFLTNPDELRERYNINVFIKTEVLEIYPDTLTMKVVNLETNEERIDSYNKLVLSPGAQPIVPPFPGRDLPGIFTIRAVPDTELVRTWLASHKGAKSCVVIGGGFIGLEMAENLITLGLSTTVIDLADQIMTPLDREMAVYAEGSLTSNGIQLVLSDGVSKFEQLDNERIKVVTSKGASFDTDLVIMAIGVRPDNKLAKECNLKIAPSGCIEVNEKQLTSHPDVYAVGDVTEKFNIVSNEHSPFYMAGPANRQGRIAADAISGHRQHLFRGVQGTAVCGLFGVQVAMTGLTEKALLKMGKVKGIDFDCVYLHPLDHVEYYPDSHRIHMKAIFSVPEGKLIGAQAIGLKGAERRIDIISMAMQMNATVYDLAESELCYSPQYGAAKDAINLIGFYGINTLEGYAHNAYWNSNEKQRDGVQLIDVREADEFDDSKMVPNAKNIPMSEIRVRCEKELNKDDDIRVFCLTGVRGHSVVRMLLQKGYTKAKNISGGYVSYLAQVNDEGLTQDQFN